MEPIEIQIDDQYNWLTKSQKMKIRNSFRQGKTKDEILKSIHYMNHDERYNDYSQSNINDKKILLKFNVVSDKDQNRKQLLERLRSKINHKTSTRNKIKENQKSDSWKLYNEILNHPGVKNLSPDIIQKMLPNPDEIQKNPELYRSINENNPNPLIKKYIHLCLS